MKTNNQAEKDFSTERNDVLSRLWALILKETREILRNPYLLFLIIVPPTIQLLILGGSLDPQVRNLKLGVVDHCRSVESRDLISGVQNSGVFPLTNNYTEEKTAWQQLDNGKLDVAMVIPEEFTRDLARGVAAPVQVVVDGADAYSAAIASAYVLRTINAYKPEGFNAAFKARVVADIKSRAQETAHQFSSSRTDLGAAEGRSGGCAVSNSNNAIINGNAEKASTIVSPDIQILYNPGLLASWFFVPGVLGACITLTTTLVASAAVLRERESGTMEQLLMTPAETWEILLAKVVPLVGFLVTDVCLATGASMLAFNLPFRGNFVIFLAASTLYICVGIGFGMLLGTLCKNQRQSQLTSFFINIPLILLSGSVVPLDTMPEFLQMISNFNPLRYYIFLSRSVILKGAGMSVVWPDLCVLVIAAILLIGLSANRFNRQVA